MNTSPSILRRRIGRISALLAMTSTLLVGGMSSADAAPADPPQTQDLSNICLYQHQNFNNFSLGKSVCFSSAGDIPANLNEQITSIDNTGTFTQAWCLYDDPGQRGYYLVIAAHSSLRNLRYDAAPDGGNWNDRISSVKPLGSGC